MRERNCSFFPPTLHGHLKRIEGGYYTYVYIYISTLTMTTLSRLGRDNRHMIDQWLFIGRPMRHFWVAPPDGYADLVLARLHFLQFLRTKIAGS